MSESRKVHMDWGDVLGVEVDIRARRSNRRREVFDRAPGRQAPGANSILQKGY